MPAWVCEYIQYPYRVREIRTMLAIEVAESLVDKAIDNIVHQHRNETDEVIVAIIHREANFVA